MPALLLPVPRCSTLTDTLRRTKQRDTQFPADADLWAAIIRAIPVTPGAQDPPLYALENSATGDTFTANAPFVRDFIEHWEETRTHTVTVAAAGTLRTFRAGSRFWDFARTWAREQARHGASAAADGATPLHGLEPQPHGSAGLPPHLATAEASVTSSLAPKDPLALTLLAWCHLVHAWNAAHESSADPPRFDAAGSTPSAAAAVTERAAAEDPAHRKSTPASTPPAASSTALYSRPVPQLTTPDNVDFAAVQRRFDQRDRRGHYWTHFMSHWNILLDQYRNYF
jgi:hypothetical protein